MQRKTLAIIAGAACLAAVAGAWTMVGKQGRIQYRTASAEHGDVNVAVSATGNPNAVVTVQVGSQVSGIVVALFADFNTKVTKGQLIARIDPAPFQAKVDQAQANLDAARAAVANAQAVVQQALANIQAAKSSLAAAQANVLKSEALIEDAKVKVDRRVIMVRQGADAKEDLETAQTTYKSAVADHSAFVAQQHAVEDNVKSGRGSVERGAFARQRQPGAGETVLGGAALGPTRSRPHKHPGAGGWRRRVAERGRRTDRGGQPGGADAVSDRSGPDEDAGRYERVGSGRGTRAREPACHVHGRCVSRADVHRHRDLDPQGAHQRAERDHVRRGDRRLESRT